MKQEQQEAYEEYLDVSGEKQKAYCQLNIRIKQSDKAKLDKIVEQARKTMRIEFNLGGESIPLHEIHEPRNSITCHAIVRHWVLTKIHELVPE